MSKSAPRTQEGIADDHSDCIECSRLPDGFPCANWYINNGATITAEGY